MNMIVKLKYWVILSPMNYKKMLIFKLLLIHKIISNSMMKYIFFNIIIPNSNKNLLKLTKTIFLWINVHRLF